MLIIIVIDATTMVMYWPIIQLCQIFSQIFSYSLRSDISLSQEDIPLPETTNYY